MTSPQGRVLYVDDDADSRELVHFILKGQGYEVITAVDATEALKVVKRIPFDLFIVDVRLPDMSGFELCSKLREYGDKTPILFFSAAAQEADKKQALECGASSYLVKPLDTDSLVTEVSRVMRKT